MADRNEPTRTPRRWVPVAVIGVLALVYVTVLVLYWRSTEPTTSTIDIDENAATSSLIVGIDATAVDTKTGALSAQLKIFPPTSLLAEDGTLKHRIDVVVVAVDPDESSKVLPVDGTSARFEKGAPFLTSTITLYLQGRYQNYPLERYVSHLGVSAGWAGDDGKLHDLPAVLGLGGDVPGWTVHSAPVDETLTSGDAEVQTDAAATLTLVRAGSTVVIVAIILFALLVLVTAALLVARSVWVRKRRIEATMASWFAALMFAVIPLRTNLPGSPPMGVWIDFLVVLWVEVGLMIALAVFIASWLSYTPMPDYAPEVVAARRAEAEAEVADEPEAEAEVAGE